MQKLSPSDTLFLVMDTPNTPMSIGALTIADKASAGENFDLKRDVKDFIESRLHLSPNMRKKLAFHPLDLEEPRLVDAADFDIDSHIRFETLPAPNDWTALTDLVSKIIAIPMDMRKPLWEYYIIDGLSNHADAPETSFAVLTKFHHSVFDGGSAGATMWQFMQDAPGETVTPPATPWQPKKEPDLYDWTMSSMIESSMQWTKSVEYMQGFSNGIMNLLSRPKEDKPKAPTQKLVAPNMRFSQGLSQERTWDSISIPMVELQELRAALGKPKMNDIFLTIIAGGLRSYLQKTDELPDAPLLTLCPISVRENNPLEGGNFLSAMRVSLFTDFADPLERLKAITESSDSSKGTVQTLGKDFAAHVLGMTHYMAQKNVLGRMHALPNHLEVSAPPLANMTISNAPPPKGGHYFANCKVVTSSGFGPIFNFIGVTHAITGMDFESSIGITACKKLLPDIQFYCECIRQSYRELQAAAGIKTETTKPKTAKAKTTTAKTTTAKTTTAKTATTAKKSTRTRRQAKQV